MLADLGLNACWYLLQVEQPLTMVLEPPPRVLTIVGTGRHQLDVQQAGIYYARSQDGRTSCSATDPVAESFHRWFTTYSSVSASG
ncbi:MAG TPA: hypothetical protein VNF71_15200 [Acidimicrobiales bacterium]|nr:hypothetical protein [Acidimicrobiales bacterium]